MDKTEIRVQLLEKRNALTHEERASKSEKIARNLEKIEQFKEAKQVLFYYTHGSEVDCLPLINKWMNKKKIYLPKLMENGKFKALPFFEFEGLKKGPFNIPEPTLDDHEEHEGILDLIIVPGVAFDKKGNRIGMGKGFYDRYLSKTEDTKKIALAFSEQVLDEVPKDTYDIPVDIVVTDKEIIKCR